MPEHPSACIRLTLASASRWAGALVATILWLGASLGAQDPDASLDTAALTAAIEQSLAVVPRGFQALQSPGQAGVRVLSVAVERMPTGHRIAIDLSQKALTYDPTGDVETITDHILTSTAALTATGGAIDYRFLVDGSPLDQFLTATSAPARARALTAAARGPVIISPGHGWYRHEASGTWRLQRDYFWGIVEDFVNWDIVRYIHDELWTANIPVQAARDMDPYSGIGETGHPRWEESAKYYIKMLGAPAPVWDFGINDYNRDINSRPFYANWVDAALVVSVHNNGGGGTGTETWYDATNGQEAESRRLAEIVNRRVVAAIRAHYDPDWPDRGLRSCNGCKGETRLAYRPAIILEVAFMDRKTPDNDALHDERFKQIVARAVREGVEEWAGQSGLPDDEISRTVP